jgi:hypothetical protein
MKRRRSRTRSKTDDDSNKCSRPPRSALSPGRTFLSCCSIHSPAHTLDLPRIVYKHLPRFLYKTYVYTYTQYIQIITRARTYYYLIFMYVHTLCIVLYKMPGRNSLRPQTSDRINYYYTHNIHTQW